MIEEYGESNITREQLMALGESELQSKELQETIREKGSVKFPVDVSFEDLMDLADESVVADIQTVAEPIVSTIKGALDDSGGVATSAIAFELIARLQPLGNVMRSGILSNACGALERHLTRLAYLAGELPATGTRPLSARDLIELTNTRLGEDLDRSGGLSDIISGIFTERNSLIHREGRVDSVFVGQMKDQPVSEENLGAVLDLTDDDLRGKLDYLLGYALRAILLDWYRLGEKRTFDSMLSFAQIHLLAQEHWITLALITDEPFEAMELEDYRATTRVNYLLSLKNLADDSVREEYYQRVRAWEPPDDDTWRLAVLALLDRNAEAVSMILAKPELRDLLEPINRVFAELMDDPRLL